MIKKIIIITIILICFACSTTGKLNTPEKFNDNTRGTWQTLGRSLLTRPDKVINIDWHGYGGNVQYMLEFVHYIQKAQEEGKIVNFILDGNSYSAHAVATCYASSIQNNDKYFLMFHGVYDINTGERLTDKSDPYWIKWMNVVLEQCVQKGIIQEEDKYSVLHGSEEYVTYKDGQYVRIYKVDQRKVKQ